MNGRLVSGIIAGTVVGAAWGILAAPKPGMETRRILWAETDGYLAAFLERFRKDRHEKDQVPLGD